MMIIDQLTTGSVSKLPNIASTQWKCSRKALSKKFPRKVLLRMILFKRIMKMLQRGSTPRPCWH